MCFSAPASFLAAAVAGSAGVLAISHVRHRSEVPLAAMPLFFAAQQAVEGMLWLTLPVTADGPFTDLLTQLFLLFALVLWPVYAPACVLVIETDAQRRMAISACFVAGLAVAGYFLWALAAAPQSAAVSEHHIIYSGDPNLPAIIHVLYPVATVGALLLSSHAKVRWVGMLVAIGSVAAFMAYWHAFTSVWCFFAAAASGLLVLHFADERRRAIKAADYRKRA